MNSPFWTNPRFCYVYKTVETITLAFDELDLIFCLGLIDVLNSNTQAV